MECLLRWAGCCHAPHWRKHQMLWDLTRMGNLALSTQSSCWARRGRKEAIKNLVPGAFIRASGSQNSSVNESWVLLLRRVVCSPLTPVGGEDPQACLREDCCFKISAPRAREIDFNIRLYIGASEQRGQYLQLSLRQAESRRSSSPYRSVMGLQGTRMDIIWMGRGLIYQAKEFLLHPDISGEKPEGALKRPGDI